MEIQTFSPLQAEMLILLGNIEQYVEQGRHLSSGPQSRCLFCRVATYLWQPSGNLKLPKIHRFTARNSSK